MNIDKRPKITIKPSAKKPEQRDACMESWKILVIDDDPGIVLITKHILKDFTFEGRPLVMYSADSFETGAELYEQHPDASVALIDVMMAVPDAGLRLVKYIREEKNNSIIQLVLRTGQPGNTPEREILLGYEINDYVHKVELSAKVLQNRLIGYLRNFSNLKKVKDQYYELSQLARRRSQFVSIISQELTSSINAIAELTSQVKRDHKDSKSANSLEAILSYNQHLSYLNAELRDFISTSPTTFSPVSEYTAMADVIATVQPVFKLLQAQHSQEKPVELEIHLDSGMPEVYLDLKRCQQILIAIVAHALQFAEGVKVILTAQVLGNMLKLVVKDATVEESECKVKYIPSCFESLGFKVKSCSKYESHFFRLVLINTNVVAQGGNFSVSTVLNKGSVYTINLPIHKPKNGNHTN